MLITYFIVEAMHRTIMREVSMHIWDFRSLVALKN